MSVTVKFKKLDDKAILPAAMTDGAAAFDVVATSEHVEGRYVEYGLGFAMEIPTGYFADVRPRSSIRDKDLILINSPGTIDADYRGEVKVSFKPLMMRGSRKYEVGDRVAQILILKRTDAVFEEAMELSVTNRGDGGFGSTGG